MCWGNAARWTPPRCKSRSRIPLLFGAPVLALLALSSLMTRVFPYLMLLVERVYHLLGRGVVGGELGRVGPRVTRVRGLADDGNPHN